MFWRIRSGKLDGPEWCESFIITLARETGWTEKFLMEAPLAKLMRYYHAALWVNGAWTRKSASKDKVATVEEMLANFKPTIEEDDDGEVY